MIKIEEGKFYKRRDGEIVGPIDHLVMRAVNGFNWRAAGDPECSWRDDGKYLATRESVLDLVEEVAMETSGEDVNRIFAEEEPVVADQPHDPVDHPPHYTGHPSGVECIAIVEHMNFCRGNAIKYIWRAGDKGGEIEDLKKARWYIDREIERLTKSA